QRTRWFTVSGNVSHPFDDVLVVASHSLPLNYVEKLEPWDLGNITRFDERFLGGFITEKYKVELKEGFDTAKTKMDTYIRTLVRRDIGGDEQRIISLQTDHSNITFKHILLPIYLSAFRFKGKVYNFLVNGRTGEVQGERPYSAWKIALLVIAVLAVLGVVIYFASKK
ncbi:MAG: DNA helicase PriA, partial [Flavobacteriales bacterium]|nr:DNA helicase PriA [Flavobacteriales bacterium]